MNWKKLSNNCWHFIYTGSNNAVFNMAFDNYFFDKFMNNELHYPMLRLYSWSECSLSLGANQLMPDRKTISCFKEEDVVRRLTGGQAVFHDKKENEITYSVVIKNNVGFRKVYNMISDVLIYFLRLYGLNPEAGYSNNNYSNDFNCFNSKTEADIVIDGQKVIGSAQYRKNNCILQHGSIKLNNISTILVQDLNFDEVLSRLKSSFKNVLNITFLDYALTAQDYEKIKDICEGMYKCKIQA